MIKENLQEVERRICEACKRSGRDRSEVQLIAVSKTKPVSMIEEAYAEGIRRFGEIRRNGKRYQMAYDRSFTEK